MIYIARAVDKKAQPTIAFSQRGIAGLTQGRISDINLFAKPCEQQLAYDGYRNSIEAFIFATAVGKKVSCSAGQFPIPAAYNPTVPLPLPQTVFQLAKKPSDQFVEQFTSALEEFGLEKVNAGKGNPTFSLKRPTLPLLRDKLHIYASASSPQIDSFAQLPASRSFLQIYQYVDLFLAVNTYEYKGQDIHEEPTYPEYLATTTEFRISAAYFRPGIPDAKSQSM
jgi:hypothetical protein